MGFEEWWQTKSGRAKTIAVSTTLLILQVGLCFGTSSIADWYNAELHLPVDPAYVVAGMFVQLLLGVVTAGVLISALIGVFQPARKTTNKKAPHDR